MQPTERKIPSPSSGGSRLLGGDDERRFSRQVIWRRLALLTVAAFGGRWIMQRPPVHRTLRAITARTRRRAHYWQGRARGLRYALQRRHPDLEVSGTVLADRIRSSLGPLEKRLDIPRVHVMVDDHVAFLHGDVPSDADERTVVDAALDVPGVTGVVSYLHAGLLPSDARPSEGHRHAEGSHALRRLLAAAETAGAANPRRAVRATLATLADRIPAGERRHLRSHLPEDVRQLTESVVHAGRRVNTVEGFVEAVARTGAFVDTTRRPEVIAAILGELRALAADEAEDIAAVLPGDLRQLWLAGAQR